MKDRLNHDQRQLLYSVCLEEVVLDDDREREIASVLELSWVHAELGRRTSHISAVGRSTPYS
jgi:hypothetical protein